MSADELANIESLTDQDILLLLESKDLTPEVLELIEQYQQARSTSDSNDNAEAAAVEEAGGSSEFSIGDKCAITFSYKDDMVLLPAIIVDIAESTTQVLILTPITRNTIPCSQYFSQSTSCKKESCPYSHGYTLPSEFVAPFEALGTHNADTLLAQLQYGKRVWCKENDSQDIWQLGNIIDQLHGPRWRVRLKDSKKRIRVDMEHIMPFKSLLNDEDGDSMDEWSESDHGDTTDIESGAEEDGPAVIASRPDDAFGSWETHTTGFASKMMKKMGYIQVRHSTVFYSCVSLIFSLQTGPRSRRGWERTTRANPGTTVQWQFSGSTAWIRTGAEEETAIQKEETKGDYKGGTRRDGYVWSNELSAGETTNRRENISNDSPTTTQQVDRYPPD